jgi:hypothetical protein
MNIQHLTDLHLDINRRADPLSRFLVVPDAAVIALTGDLSNHALDSINFIKYTLLPQTLPHQHIVFVLGNHEFYGCPIDLAYQYAKDIDHPRIHFLCQGQVFEHEGVCFVGDTLWTDFALAGDVDAAMLQAGYCLSDFSRILRDGRILKPSETVDYFHQTLASFSRSIAATACERVVVLSHHGPSRRSISPRFTGDALNPAFVSEVLEHVRFDRSVVLWLHGHVHDAFDYALGATRVVCNPLGYLSSPDEGRDFDGAKLISV